MSRLSGYLIRLFAADAGALFAIAAFLLFLMQSLRSFDVVSVKGQDLLTLLGQALLTMPTLAIAFMFVCIGIGLARALKALQLTQELHIIHSSRRTGSLFRAIGVYALAGVAMILLLTHVIEPNTKRYFNAWSASIAADLVGRSLRPHRFVEVTPGVTLRIGGRGFDGELSNFFADDRRAPDVRRTYFAASASVAADESGYVLQLRDGAIQYMTDERQFSEISFARYDLAVDRLTSTPSVSGGLDAVATLDLINADLAASGTISLPTLEQIGNRSGEGLRVLAICLMVAAMAAFPHGRRTRFEIPIEIVVISVALIERLFSARFSFGLPLLPFSGPVVLSLGSLAVLAWRLRPRLPPAAAMARP